MADFSQSVAIPSTGSYAAPLMNFGVIGDLANDYEQGRKNQFAEQERQRQLALQQPVNASDPKGMALELAKRDPGMAAQLLPFLLGQEPGQVSPLLGGTPAPAAPQGGPQSAPQGGAGAPSAQPAPMAPAGRPGAPVGSMLPGGERIMGGDAGTGTVVDIVTGVLPENSTKTGQVIGNIAKAIGADPNAPLTPEQQAKATRLVQAYAQRNGIAAPDAGGGSGGQPGDRVLHPEPAQPWQPPQQQPQAQQEIAPIPGMILPPGFKPGQEVEAVQALRAEGAKALASSNVKTRSQAPELFKMADQIEKQLQPQKLYQGQETVDARGNVIRSGSGGSARDIADGIKTGDQPPTTTGLGRMAPQVRGLLAKDGFNLAKATQEWNAATKQIQSLNGPQMTRYAGLANSVVNTIDEVKSLADQMDNIGVPLLNKAKIAAYIQLEGNSEKGQLAARYMAGINTLKEEFANLAQGGYAPTESAWGLAEQQINGNYGVKQLSASLDEVQRLIKYRIQGIPNFSTLGPAAPGNRYFGQGAGGAEGTAPAMGAGGTQSPAAAQADHPRPATKAEYDALPKGSTYVAPDGTPRTKQ